MLKAALVFITEYGALTVVLGAISFLSWTKMTLGAVLTVVSGFLPAAKTADRAGTAQVKVGNISVLVKGAARFAVAAAGLLLIGGSLLEGFHGYVDATATHLAKPKLVPFARADATPLMTFENAILILCSKKDNIDQSFCRGAQP